MNTYTLRIDSLDVTLFDAILSQTSKKERQSLLALQRATAHRQSSFSYLEIGSYMGGSIQPYLLDDRCETIYSIDPRPPQLADDRTPGQDVRYPENSKERMLQLLQNVEQGAIGKITCFDSDASMLDARQIVKPPAIAFIDGEHTCQAVMSDYRFCAKVIDSSGTIVFHDFDVVNKAIIKICDGLKRSRKACIPLKLDDNVFAIFFDPETIFRDPYLANLYRQNRNFLRWFKLSESARRALPSAVLAFIRKIRNRFLRRQNRRKWMNF
jgi:hypothetical protein